jgi:hypothetical protein
VLDFRDGDEMAERIGGNLGRGGERPVRPCSSDAHRRRTDGGRP